MRLEKREKRYLKLLGLGARKIAEFLLEKETEEIFAFEEFCRALGGFPSVQFIAFACLGTYRGKEEIRLSLSETNFFQRFSRAAETLLAEMSKLGNDAHLTVFLADLEPCRTWGWKNVTPEEISYYCREMVEAYRRELPANWEVRLWSEVESPGGTITFSDALSWARREANPLILQGETDHIGLFPDILSRREVREHALIQVASYALEGRLLEETNPDFILLQSEFPARRKDQMYQPFRARKLPVVHPFALQRS